MKTLSIILTMMFAIMLSYAQEKDSIVTESEEVVIEEMEVVELPSYDRQVSAFNEIVIGGSKMVIHLYQDTQHFVSITVEEKRKDDIITEVEEGKLLISSKGLKKPVHVDVHFISLTKLETDHIAKIIAETTISGDSLQIISDGTSEINLKLEMKKVNTFIDGAAELVYSGNAEIHHVQVEGAAELDASELKTIKTFVDISGAGDVDINAEEEISGEISGAAKLKFVGDPNTSGLKVSGAAIIRGKSDDIVFNGKDTINLKIGNLKFNITEDDIEDMKKEKKRKYKDYEIWSGFDVGINGYLNSNNDFDMPSQYDFLELNYSKSWSVGFNLFQQDIHIVKGYFDLITGLGFEIDNYKFSKNTRLIDNPNQITGVQDTMYDFIKSKLRLSYITVPVMFEINTSADPEKALHIGAGMLFGYNIGAMTKIVYQENGDKVKSKSKSANYHINPLRYGLTARIGYGDNLVIYANYALSSMFKKDEGPELYPFSIGLSLVDF